MVGRSFLHIYPFGYHRKKSLFVCMSLVQFHRSRQPTSKNEVKHNASSERKYLFFLEPKCAVNIINP